MYNVGMRDEGSVYKHTTTTMARYSPQIRWRVELIMLQSLATSIIFFQPYTY